MAKVYTSVTKVDTLIPVILLTGIFSFISSCSLQDRADVTLLNPAVINRTVASIGKTRVTTDRDLSENDPASYKSGEKRIWSEAVKKGLWPEPVAESDWPMFGRNPHRDKESSLAFRNSNFELLWIFQPSEHIFTYREGTNLWSESAIAVNRNKRLEIIIGSYNRKVYGIDGLTGKRIWSFNTGDEVVATPVANKNGTVIISSDRTLYGLSPEGEKQWASQLQEWTHTSQPMVASSPALFRIKDSAPLYSGGYYLNDTAFFGRIQEGYACLRSAKTNENIWTRFLRKSHIYGPAAGLVANRKVLFYTTNDGLVCALTAENGKLVWQFTADQQIRSTPTFAYLKKIQCNDSGSTEGETIPVVLVTSRWGILWALNGNNGTPLWSYRAGHMCDSSPSIATLQSGRKVVIFGSYDRCLHGVFLDSGKRVWKFETKGVILSSPAVATVSGKKAIFFSSMDNHLYCIEASTGKKIWSYKTGSLPWPFFKRGDAVFSSPLICKSNGAGEKEEKTILVFPAHDGKIYAFTSSGQ